MERNCVTRVTDTLNEDQSDIFSPVPNKERKTVSIKYKYW